MSKSEPHIFVSYSRNDGLEFAQKVRDELSGIDRGLGLCVERPFSLWRDIDNLETGSDWWSQIEAALRSDSIEHLVLILTSGALVSNVVRREIRLARQEGIQVSPIRAPGFELRGVPRRLGHIVDLDIPQQRAGLLRTLEGRSIQKRVPMMAEEPPEDFINRPREFEAIKASIINTKGDVQTWENKKSGSTIAITAALTGAGGYGKTTLAQAIAHDDDVQEAFVDGILWVALGEDLNKNLIGIISDLIATIEGKTTAFETIEGAANGLAEALGERRYLLVIDDAWRHRDLRPFLRGGRLTTRLITTRDRDVVPESAARHDVDEMAEAAQLLRSGLTITTDKERNALHGLALGIKGWAQLTKLVNGRIRVRVELGIAPLDAIKTAADLYAADGPFAFDSNNAEERTRTIDKTIRLSVDWLVEAPKARFLQLGVFPENTEVPVAVVAALWELTTVAAEELLIQLARLSLLQRLDLNVGGFRLHDNIRQFLLREAAPALGKHHAQLCSALQAAVEEQSKLSYA